MRLRTQLALAVGFAVSISACATKEPYDWGAYEKSMYVYYKKPATAPDFAANLQETINGAEHDHGIVAPGLYAEYGYLLLQQGNRDGAVAAFRKEEVQWPESKAFMDRMIRVASNNAVAGTPTKGP
jgi:hypothetical protein